MPHHVTIVVPALNEERHIGECLASLRNLDPRGLTFEVVVVDNGSTDRTPDIARAAGAKILTNVTATIGGLRNAGARAGSGTIVAFVDADCTVDPSWLVSAIDVMESTGAGVVGSVHRVPADAGWVARVAAELALAKTGRVRYIPSGNMIVSRRCFEAIGGFHEDLTTAEDVDFCRRAQHAGFDVFADPRIGAVHHGVPKTTGEFFRREFWHGRDSIRVFVDDLRRVANLGVVLYALCFALLIVLSIGTVAVAAVLRSFVPLLVLAVLILAFSTTLWMVRVRHFPRMRFWILLHHLLYGAARATSLAAAITAIAFQRKRSTGSWRVKTTSRHRALAPDIPDGALKDRR